MVPKACVINNIPGSEHMFEISVITCVTVD